MLFPDLTALGGRFAVGCRVNGGPASFMAGEAGEGSPTVDTVVCTSSVGKQMMAACVGMLVLEGVLDGEDPIRWFLPELPAWADPVKLRHLIHHTSGLPDKAVWDIGFSGSVSDWTNETVLGLLATMPGLQADPGTTFSYSSVGYVCLGTIAERAGGQAVQTMMARRIFDPLGMTSTRCWAGAALHPPAVTIHPPWHPGLPAPRTVGDGGVWSTVRDLLRWADARNTGALGERLTGLLRQQGRLRDGTAVPYAWGSFVEPAKGGPAFAHGGWWPGCFTYVINTPATASSATIVAFADDPGPVEELAKQLAGVTAAPAQRAGNTTVAGAERLPTES